MWMAYTFVLISAVILNYSECSSSSTGNHDSGNQHCSSSPYADVEHDWPDQRSPEKTPARARSRSPEKSSMLLKRLGCSLEELGYLRLTPRTNESLQFEFRKYNFSEGIPIRRRTKQNRRVPVSVEEQIVLSLSNGDVFAILEYTGILRGIYARDKGSSRVKINIMSGAIDKMTSDEMRACPIGENSPIFPHSFFKSFANHNSLKSAWDAHSRPEESNLHSEPSSALCMLPSNLILGYPLEQLGYIRLVPLENHNRRFEFRRYVIPAAQPIRWKLGVTYMPVLNQEHFVLSTSEGDVFAILECTGFLRAIYTSNNTKARVKMNMMSGAIKKMTESEQRECHVGTKFPIFPRWFTKEVVNEDSLEHVYQ